MHITLIGSNVIKRPLNELIIYLPRQQKIADMQIRYNESLMINYIRNLQNINSPEYDGIIKF